jgi:hypothetical protein
MPAHCTSTLHTGHAPAPAAVYRLYAVSCQHPVCAGQTCAGHPLCPACVTEVRAARTEWTGTAEGVRVARVRSLRPSA